MFAAEGEKKSCEPLAGCARSDEDFDDLVFIIHLGDITVSHLKINLRKYIIMPAMTSKDVFHPEFSMTTIFLNGD